MYVRVLITRKRNLINAVAPDGGGGGGATLSRVFVRMRSMDCPRTVKSVAKRSCRGVARLSRALGAV